MNTHTRAARLLNIALLAALTACDPPAADPRPQPTADADLDDAASDPTDTTDDGASDDADAPDAPPPMTAPTPANIRSWILLDGDPDKVALHLDRAAAWGLTEIQLSHDLITDIASLARGPDQPRVLDAIAAARARGLRVMVWSNELSEGDIAVCFDPADPRWARRQRDYREALTAAPDLDGVVLSFGSADPPPWFAGCVCPYCLDLPDPLGGDPALRPFRVPEPAERVRFITELVHDVVTGEFGLHLAARTFIHQPEEMTWVIDGLNRVDPARTLIPMTKEVPNDWQPYYPLDPAIGAITNRPNLVEFDAAGEYWGQTSLPFAAVGYFERRILDAQARGVVGYAARVERGGRSALDTPNEVNLLAIHRLFEDPDTSPADIYRRWLPGRYGLPPDSPHLDALARIHEDTFDVGRKMYYQLGFWTLEKGSGLPARCLEPALLQSRSTARWDPAFQADYDRLDRPTPQTLLDLRQQHLEALTLAGDNLQRLDALIDDGLAGPALDDLRRRLSKQRHAAAVWMEAVEGLFSRRLHALTGDPAHAAWAISAADRLTAAADAFAQAHPGDTHPLNLDDAASCARDLRQGLPPDLSPADRSAPSLSPPTATLQDGLLTVQIAVDAPATLTLHVGGRLHALSPVASVATDSGGLVTLTAALPEDAPLWIAFALTAITDDGALIQGSDWWVRAR